jgi:hypothetical protein
LKKIFPLLTQNPAFGGISNIPPISPLIAEKIKQKLDVSNLSDDKKIELEEKEKEV